MSSKKKLGQFYTTNYEYILQNMIIPDYVFDKIIIEPFAGNGDLIKFIDDSKYKIECYDIDPKKDFIIKRDTLLEPPDYNDKYVITNPPYLARNKSTDKKIFDKYNTNDLYKCFIIELLENCCLGGIIIIPLNFLSSIRISDINLRKQFLEKYKIIMINIFEEQVFNDTTYTICSMQFELNKIKENKDIDIYCYPSNKKININLNKNNNYIIGGDIYNLNIKNKYMISRLTSKNINDKNTNILAKCIDDNKNNQINLSIVNDADIFIDETEKQSARTYATLIIKPKIDIETQKKVVKKFNEYLNENRIKYNSLFLTNYREFERKRISFDLIYSIVQYILENEIETDINHQ
jgi:hypothetical protein